MVHVFFRSVRTYRNAKTFTVVALFAAVALLAALSALQDGGKLVRSVALIFGGIAGVGGYKLINNVQEPVEINNGGIQDRDRFWPWNDIAEISATRASFSSKLNLWYTTRADGEKRILMGQKTMSRQEYADLLARLWPFVSQYFPHVRLTPAN